MLPQGTAQKGFDVSVAYYNPRHIRSTAVDINLKVAVSSHAWFFADDEHRGTLVADGMCVFL